ncbi:MAG: ATP-binding cassette domain-containing protein [Actinomycetota bacterium]
MRTDTTSPAVSLIDVTVRFGNVTAVEGLSFDVRAGERVAVLGRTGAGKSTVLNLVVGNLAPAAGTVRVVDLDPVRDADAMQGRLSMAFQSPQLLPWRTALDNVALGLEVLGVDRRERLARATHWLERVHLQDAVDRFPAQLSGGMAQRVSLARAFAIDPDLVLLDESFSALDEVTSAALRSDFVELAEQASQSALIVTHNIQEAFEVAHRVLVMARPARCVGEFVTAEYDLTDPMAMSQVRDAVRELMEQDIPSHQQTPDHTANPAASSY